LRSGDRWFSPKYLEKIIAFFAQSTVLRFDVETQLVERHVVERNVVENKVVEATYCRKYENVHSTQSRYW
jgi:hypothetical protein